jgi:competence protein ComEA
VAAFSVSVAQRRMLALVLLCVVAAVVVVRQHHPAARAGPALRVSPIRPAAIGGAAPARKRIVVDVVGAVARPGLYRLATGSRVADAVARAGGLTRRAERTAVNLAAPLADGEQLLVAARGAGGVAVTPGGAAGPATGPVSLSTATAEQLDTLPGVGPVTAQKIIAYREQNGPFTSVEALDAIPGIGPARIADLKGLVVP